MRLHPDIVFLDPPPDSNWSASSLPSLSPAQTYWLQRPGALTAGLRKLGHVDLRVTREYESQLPASEAWMLLSSADSPIWVREIVMAIDGQDSVVARSFTPLKASQGLWAGMRSLQTRPLADMLYNDPEISRSPFYNSRLTQAQPLYDAIKSALGPRTPPAPQLLARCSAFWRRGEPLLVAECFLPAFWDFAPETDPELDSDLPH